MRMQPPPASRRGWGRQLRWEGEADHSRQSLGGGTIQAGGEEEMLMTEEQAEIPGQPETRGEGCWGGRGKGQVQNGP